MPSCFNISVYRARFPNPFVAFPLDGPKFFPSRPQNMPVYPPGYLPHSQPPVSLNNSSVPSFGHPLKESSSILSISIDGNHQEEDKDGGDDQSLSNDEKPAREKRMMGTSAYKKRNVYKSIVRHMFGYMRKHREDIIALLRKAGYKLQDIEHAFFKINYYNDMERQKGNPKKSQSIIKKIVNKRCIYTYLLRETLKSMIMTWDQGRLGKVSTANREIYREVCLRYYNEALRTLGETPP